MTRSLIPNSTPIPDVILDHWMAELSGAEFKVLLYIARRTYGFGKDADTISLSQIAHGMVRRDGTPLDRGTGASRSSVSRSLKVLEEQGLVIRTTNLAESGREYAVNTYRINLEWEPPPRGGQSDPSKGGRSKEEEGVVSKSDHPVTKPAGGWSQFDTRVVSKSDPQETDLQETDQDTASQSMASRGADDDLVGVLVEKGVGRTVARRLVSEKPEVCRRCLEYLPFAKVRTTPGAWLANAIREEYGPPAGFVSQPATMPHPACQQNPARIQERIPSPQVRERYVRVMASEPNTRAAFELYLAREEERASRFASTLTEAGKSRYLSSFKSEEHRLELFARWLNVRGGVSPGMSHPSQESPSTLRPPSESDSGARTLN